MARKLTGLMLFWVWFLLIATIIGGLELIGLGAGLMGFGGFSVLGFFGDAFGGFLAILAGFLVAWAGIMNLLRGMKR